MLRRRKLLVSLPQLLHMQPVVLSTTLSSTGMASRCCYSSECPPAIAPSAPLLQLRVPSWPSTKPLVVIRRTFRRKLTTAHFCKRRAYLLLGVHHNRSWCWSSVELRRNGGRREIMHSISGTIICILNKREIICILSVLVQCSLGAHHATRSAR
jgi:hypothetical protein